MHLSVCLPAGAGRGVRTCCPAGDVSAAAAAASAAAAAAAPDAPSAGLGDWACPCGKTVSSACWGRVRGSRYLGPRRGVEEGEEGWTHWYACFRSLHSRADSHTSPPSVSLPPQPGPRHTPHSVLPYVPSSLGFHQMCLR